MFGRLGLGFGRLGLVFGRLGLRVCEVRLGLGGMRFHHKPTFHSSNLEPVDGAAVDKRREHPEATPERVAYWTHRQHDVQVLLDALDEEVVHGERRRRFHLPTLKYDHNQVQFTDAELQKS